MPYSNKVLHTRRYNKPLEDDAADKPPDSQLLNGTTTEPTNKHDISIDSNYNMGPRSSSHKPSTPEDQQELTNSHQSSSVERVKKPKKELSDEVDLAAQRISKSSDIEHVEIAAVEDFKWYDVAWYLFSIVSYLADVGFDIWVAHGYYTQGYMNWFALTVVFIIAPAITMNILSLVWYLQDRKTAKDGKAMWTSRVLFLVLQIGPVIRYIECLIYGVQSKKKKACYQRLLWEDSDAALLRLLECCMEAGPQLILQLYIMASHGVDGGQMIVLKQTGSCITSLISIAWAISAYHKALRLSIPEAGKIGFGAMTLHFFWHIFIIGSRVLALAMFASQAHYWVFVAVGCHWIFMFFWILAQKSRFCNTKCQEFFFNLLTSLIYIYCYFNLLNGRTRLRYVFYYSLTLLESTALMILWYMYAGTSSSWHIIPAMVGVFGGFAVGIVLQVLYYTCCHPNHLPEIKERENTTEINKFVPLKDLSLYKNTVKYPCTGSKGNDDLCKTTQSGGDDTHMESNRLTSENV